MTKTLEKDWITLYIPSKGIETKAIKDLDKKGKPVTKHFVYGSINGKPFEVECDCQVKVTPEVAEALHGLLHKQAGR